METGNYQKQRGFLKSKLAKTFSRGLMKRSWPGQCSSTSSSNKVRPSPSSARNGSGSGSVSYLSVHQDLQSPSSSMQKVAPLSTAKPTSYGYFDYGHGDGGGGDENVDMKATDFIVYVRERFQQERPVNSNAF